MEKTIIARIFDGSIIYSYLMYTYGDRNAVSIIFKEEGVLITYADCYDDIFGDSHFFTNYDSLTYEELLNYSYDFAMGMFELYYCGDLLL